MKIKIYCILLLFYILQAPILLNAQQAQNSVSEPISAKETVDLNTIDNLASLRYQSIHEELSAENLFRLASFYLVSEIYGKSSELYAFTIAKIDQDTMLSQEQKKQQKAFAYYNRALGLFALELYDSAKKNFQFAYKEQSSLHDAIRMLGTIAFIQKNKNEALKSWKEYLILNTNQSPERDAVEKAVSLLENPNFSFDAPEKSPPTETSPTWPFLNPETIPYPDSHYEKQRVV